MFQRNPSARLGPVHLVALAAVLLFATAAPTTLAFCPTNGVKCGFGAVGTTHKEMTTDSIRELDEEFFGTDRLTDGMKQAIEDVWKANAAVDDKVNQKTGFKHFDGESFSAAKQRLISLFDGVVSSLEAEDGKGARKQLGAALHTLQDFYAHSNFVEGGGGGAVTALWRSGETIPAAAARNAATCQDCELIVIPGMPPTVIVDCSSNIVTSLLTSGYYGEQNEKPQVTTKCRHGGPFDSGPGPFGGINKDTIFATFSPHSGFHGSAAGAAAAATKAFIRDIRDRVTERQLKLLLGVGPTIAMSIDTTGSMGSIIAQVRSEAIQIVNSRLGTDQEPLQYILSPFNDPFLGPLTVTDDPDTFKSAISALFASGGGDCPELAMNGALRAINAADDGTDLFTFTDAAAKDQALAGSVSSLAQSKDAKIYPLLFGTCFGFADDPGQDGGASAGGDPSNFLFGDPAFRRVASDSGGQLFALSFSEAGNITTLVDAVARADAVDILSVADTLGGASLTYTVPVDSTLSRFTVSLSGATGLVLTRPDGSIVAPTDSGISRVDLSNGVLVTDLMPQTGIWTAEVSGSGEFSLNVVGESPVDLDRFDFVELDGRPGHQGLFEVTGLPVVDSESILNAEMSGDLQSAQFELRTKAGAVIQTLDLAADPAGDPNELFGSEILPNEPFLVYVTGLLSGGDTYQRVLAKSIEPQTVQLIAEDTELPVGETTDVLFEVTNFGAPDTFRIIVSDSLGFFGIGAATFSLGTGESISLIAPFTVPEGTPLGTVTVITSDVDSLTGSGARNFAVVDAVVVEVAQVVVDCAAAAPSVDLLWPPNHKFAAVEVLGVTSSDGAPVDVTIDGILQNEPTLDLGEGNTCPDGQGIGTDTAEVRAERSGLGDGRRYSILFSGTTATGGACEGSVEVCVPHDRGGGCENAGEPVHDSTACP